MTFYVWISISNTKYPFRIRCARNTGNIFPRASWIQIENSVTNGFARTFMQHIRELYTGILHANSYHHNQIVQIQIMMTSSNGSIFGVTGHLCGEITGHWWIPRTKAGDAELYLVFYLICAWINAWLNNYKAGDLRRHCVNYDFTVMLPDVKYTKWH